MHSSCLLRLKCRSSRPVNKTMSGCDEISTEYPFNKGFGRLRPDFKLKRFFCKEQRSSIDISFRGRNVLLKPGVVTFSIYLTQHAATFTALDAADAGF